MPGAWPPGSSSPSKSAGSRSAQPIVALNSGALLSSAYQALGSGLAPSWPKRTPVSSRGSAAGPVPACSVAKTTSCPAAHSSCHGTATSVTSKSASGSGISTRTGPSSQRSPEPLTGLALSNGTFSERAGPVRWLVRDRGRRLRGRDGLRIGGTGDCGPGPADGDAARGREHVVDEPVGICLLGGCGGAVGRLGSGAREPVDDVAPAGRGPRSAYILRGHRRAQVREPESLPQRPAA